MSQGRVIETTLRVRYAETDAMGVVYHANYLVWFEVGRGDYFRAMSQDYGEWEKQGALLPVSEVSARYHAPAHYGELILVRTWVEEVRSRSVTLGYEVRNSSTQQRLVTGWTRHVCVNRQGQVRRLPQEMLQALEAP
jgi:acyl-CoA thioester hydrolase